MPDRADHRWYRATRVSRPRLPSVALVALVLGALAGAGAGWFGAAAGLRRAREHPVGRHRPQAASAAQPARYPAAGAAALLLAVAAVASGTWGDYLRAVEAAVAAWGGFAVLAVAAPSALGWGDVRLAGVLGGYLGYVGWRAVYDGLLAEFLLGAIVALALLAIARVTRKSALPFGPMLLLGALAILAMERHGRLLW